MIDKTREGKRCRILNYQLAKLPNIEILWRLPILYIQIKYIYFFKMIHRNKETFNLLAMLSMTKLFRNIRN